MMKGKVWSQIIFLAFALLFFLVPLLLTPWNYELFEFNKMVLTYFLTVIIVWAWINKIIIKKRIIFRRTFWDFPLLLFFASQLISTLISIDRHTSIFGYYSRFHGGLLSTLCYLLLYWGLVSHLSSDQKTKLIKIILISGSLVALYGVAEHFGIDKDVWVQEVQNRVFSTLGQPNWLAAYLDVLIFINLSLLFSAGKTPFVLLYILHSLFYLCLLYTKSRSGFLGFIIPFSIFSTSKLIQSVKEKNHQLNKKLFILIGLTLIISLLIGIPFQLKNLSQKLNLSFLSDVQEKSSLTEIQSAKKIKTKYPKITPSSDIRKIVWQGALELWRRYPLFGTGVETFAYTYYWVRPKEHNFTSEWDFLYNKAHNELLNFAANSGTLGLISYLVLVFSAIFYAFKEKQRLSLTHYALLSILITNFFGFSVVPIALFFFLLPALSQLNNKQLEEQSSQQKQNAQNKNKLPNYLIIANTFLAVFLLSRIINYWLADYHFARGRKLEKAGYLSQAISQLDQAIKLNQNEPNFYSQRAIILAKLAAGLTQEEKNKKQSQLINQLINKAIADSQRALQVSPFHLNFYKNQAKMYYYLSFVKLEYLRNALETLLAAEKLAPTDPKIPYNIGLIYQTFDDQERAQKYLQKALELKPDYQAAQTALKQLEEKK